MSETPSGPALPQQCTCEGCAMDPLTSIPHGPSRGAALGACHHGNGPPPLCSGPRHFLPSQDSVYLEECSVSASLGESPVLRGGKPHSVLWVLLCLLLGVHCAARARLLCPHLPWQARWPQVKVGLASHRLPVTPALRSPPPLFWPILLCRGSPCSPAITHSLGSPISGPSGPPDLLSLWRHCCLPSLKPKQHKSVTKSDVSWAPRKFCEVVPTCSVPIFQVRRLRPRVWLTHV